MVAAGFLVLVSVLSVGPVGDAANPASAGQPEDGGSATDGSSASGIDGDGSGSGANQRPFDLDVRNLEECGRACRDVTVALTNNGANPRDNITVTTTPYAGDESVWSGEASIGTLASDGSTTRTEHVELGFVEGANIKRNDGVVTVETVVRWRGGSATFREDRAVV